METALEYGAWVVVGVIVIGLWRLIIFILNKLFGKKDLYVERKKEVIKSLPRKSVD